MSKPLIEIMFPDEKPGRGGRRAGAGRKPKAAEKREQRSVNLTPAVWLFIARIQAEQGGSENDALESICRTHPLFTTAEHD